MRRLIFVVSLGVCLTAVSDPAEVWLTKERAAQLRAITSRPYAAQREDLGGGRERVHWRNGSREWVTTQEVRRVVGAKATNPYAEAKREAAEARAEKEALITELKESAGNPTAKSVSEIVSRHDRKNETVGGSLNKK